VIKKKKKKTKSVRPSRGVDLNQITKKASTNDPVPIDQNGKKGNVLLVVSPNTNDLTLIGTWIAKISETRAGIKILSISGLTVLLLTFPKTAPLTLPNNNSSNSKSKILFRNKEITL
jgi:hypothetical protein